MRAAERKRTIREEPTEDGHRLHHAIDPDAGRVKVEPDRRVFGFVPAGTNPHHDAALADQVERREVLGEHRRVAKVVVEDQRAEAQAFGRHGHGREHRDGRQLPEQVIVNAQVAVPDGLRHLGPTHERRPVDDAAGPNHELEWPHAAIFADRPAGGQTDAEGQVTGWRRIVLSRSGALVWGLPRYSS